MIIKYNFQTRAIFDFKFFVFSGRAYKILLDRRVSVVGIYTDNGNILMLSSVYSKYGKHTYT